MQNLKFFEVIFLICVFTTIFHTTKAVDGTEGVTLPTIVGTIENVTAAEGKTAKFTCTVRNLNKYHVVWFHVERNMLLTIHTKIVTRINRFRVIQDDKERWTLEIREVMQEDKGAYACQVNTEPQLRKIGYLDVVVSPEIDDSRSSPSTVVVKENGNVTLTCHALGNPQPNISWVREDHGPITMIHRQKVYKHDGPTLELRKVSRSDMGAYLCIASNGYPPSVSKRTELFVEFSPIVIIPNQLLAAPKGTSVTLECVTEAYPRAVIYWKYKNHMVMSTHKYHIEEKHENYRTRVLLTINELNVDDFGSYMCNSRNSFGENIGEVELNELTIPEVKSKPNGMRRLDRDKDETVFHEVKFQSSGSIDGSKSQSHVLIDMGSNTGSMVGNRTASKNDFKPMYNQHDRDRSPSSSGFGDGGAASIFNTYFPDVSAAESEYAISLPKLMTITFLAILGDSFWQHLVKYGNMLFR